MSIITTKTGDDNFRRIGLTVAVGVLHEQDIGRVRNPDSAMSDCDAAGDVQAFHEHRELVHAPVGIGIFKNLDSVFSRSRSSPGILERFRNPESTSFIDGH